MTTNLQESPTNLADMVEALRSSQREDPVYHLLALTFEFDEQQLLQLACLYPLATDFELGRGAMRRLLDLRPLVLYDASKTKECASLPQFLELYPCHVPGFACHHSKAYLAITEKTVRLMLGSFNLTRSGLFHNREVLDSFCWSATQLRHGDLLRQWTAFLRTAYGHKVEASSRSALQAILDELEYRCAVWPLTDDGQVELLTSGYGGDTGLAQLVATWHRWYPNRQPDNLLVVSPFFDLNPDSGCLAQDVAQMFPSVQHFSLVTEENALKILSRVHFDSWKDNKLYIAPAAPPTEELQHIQLAAQERINTEEIVFTRRLHAKVWLLWQGAKGLLYVGSANFSRKAWQNRNLELGVVRRVTNPTDIYDTILHNLYVEQKNYFGLLPAATPTSFDTDAEGEGYDFTAPYPWGIACIVLAPHAESAAKEGARQGDVCFEITPSSEEPRFVPEDWNVDWDGQPLTFRCEKSQRIERKDWVSRLLRRRNLAFRQKSDPQAVYWMPFQYAPSLVEERHALYAPSTLDWLLMHLEPERDDSDPVGNGEDADNLAIASPEADSYRSNNPIVAMQTYLTVFQRFEHQLAQRIAEALELEVVLQNTKLRRAVVEPATTLAILLLKERELPNVDAVALTFKLGELALTVHRLSTRPEIVACFCELKAKLSSALKDLNTRQPDIRTYLEFIMKEINAAATRTGRTRP